MTKFIQTQLQQTNKLNQLQKIKYQSFKINNLNNLAMDIQFDRQYLSTLGIVFEDLDHFIHQKNNQYLIFALLQIKKTVRKNFSHQMTSLDKKSNASHSLKNCSEQKSSLSVHSAAKSLNKHSHASFDIIKAAQNFNQIRTKGIPQQNYTQRYEQYQGYLTHQDQQPSSSSQPRKRTTLKGGKTSNIVPNLVGLVSSEQISEIEQPFSTESRDKKQQTLRAYQHSIQEVQDDDDQFQDIVLNRLDAIERKVNQMLRQKRHQRLSTLNSRTVTSQPYYVHKSKLQNVVSGPNIIYKNPNKSDIYQFPQSRNPRSTAMISPRVFTFKDSNHISVNPPSKKMANQISKPNFTDRAQFSSKIAINKNYHTDNQLHAEQQEIGEEIFMNNELQQYGVVDGQNIVKNKKLGHYRESQKTINQPQDNQIINSSSEKVQKEVETQINYGKIKQQAQKDKVFKYIPFSKITANKGQNPGQKTQRQISRKNQDPRQMQLKNVSYNPSYNQRMPIEGIRNYETMSQDNMQIQRQKQKSPLDQINNRKNTHRDEKYHSGKDSGIRGNQVIGSDIKAYTQQGDYLDREEALSISSEKNIYSEIRQLREMTTMYGAGREKKLISLGQKQKLQTNNLQGIKKTKKDDYDYKYHQKTERMKYTSSRNYTQPVNYVEEQQVIIQASYPEERVPRVIKKIPHHAPVLISQANTIQQPSRYVQYSNHPADYGHGVHNVSYQPVYLVRERPESAYQQVQMYEESFYRGPSSNQFQTVIMHDSSKSKISNRKLSSGSVNSYNSIPYVRVKDNPQINKEKSVEYFVQRPVHYVQKPVYREI